MLDNLWVEKFRPLTLDGYVFQNDDQKSQINEWVSDGTIPHLLFSGSAGTGKTTLAKILINLLEVNQYDIMEINASRENSVDVMREKITRFVQTMPFGDFKVVLLDECLDENTTVVVLRNGKEENIKIKDLDDINDLVKSFNVVDNIVEWKPFQLFNKGIQETLKIEFENNETVICTNDHKWYVENNEGEVIVVKASELYKYEHILTP